MERQQNNNTPINQNGNNDNRKRRIFISHLEKSVTNEELRVKINYIIKLLQRKFFNILVL